MKKTFALVLVIWLLHPLVSFSQDIPKAPPKPVSGQIAVDSDDYVIGPEDVLYIHVWKEQAISRTVPVRMDGKISLPLIDDVKADGLTPLQLKEALIKKLKQVIEDPSVSVTVIEANSFKVFVIGEVKSPGVYRLKSKTTFVQLITMAGGLSEWANPKKILVIRKEKDSDKRFYVNFKRIINGEDADIDIQRDDRIIVQ